MVHEDSFIGLGGTKIHYLSSGEPVHGTILLLHGMSFSSSNWVDIGAMEKFSSYGYRVVAVDYPGYGRTEPSMSYDPGKAPDAYSSFVSNLIEEMQLDRIIITGPSMGGGIALAAMTANVKGIVAGILIAPAYGNVENLLSRVEVPVLIIWGKADPVIPLSRGWKLHDLIAGSKLVTVENAGHAVYLDKPERFFTIVRDFLESIR